MRIKDSVQTTRLPTKKRSARLHHNERRRPFVSDPAPVAADRHPAEVHGPEICAKIEHAGHAIDIHRLDSGVVGDGGVRKWSIG